jgi:two-component sensor histidine kinase
VADIIREQLTMDGDPERISLQGAPALLRASSALALALVLHELGTNARKYGALSAPQGRLVVTWNIARENSEPVLQLNWCEQGGPPVRAPEKAGFGTTLIAHSLKGVGGQTRLEFSRDGLRCQIQLPLAIQDGKEDQQRRPAHHERQTDPGD